MANAHRGEVGFTADGKDWTMKWGTEAQCHAEDATGMTVGQIGDAVNNGGASAKLLRAIVWASLQDHHEGTSLKEASRIIDELGGDEIARLIADAAERAAPVQNGGGARPRKAAAR